MAKGRKLGYIDLDVPKVRSWADHGKNRTEIAQELGITVEDLDERLAELTIRNRKSAAAIKQMLDRNDKASKSRRKPAQFEAKSAPILAPTSPAPTASIPAEDSAKKAPSTTKAIRSEAEVVQSKIESCEESLANINRACDDARMTIADSKVKAARYEQELKDLLAKLEHFKASYEAEKQRLANAEEILISGEARRNATQKRLTALKAELEKLKKPEIYVCADGITAENVTVPKTINVSGWAQLIDSLPEEIGSELRKRDAELLLKLRAIVHNIERKDVEIVFESESLERAYRAMIAN